jgi:hypothetical protein
MATPSQPLEIILPGPGNRTGYLNPYTGTYTTSRTYGLRMQRGYARGLPQYSARGKPRDEYGQRRQQIQEEYQQTPYERMTQQFERRYGFSYRYWRQLRRRWIDEINSLTSPGSGVIPDHIARVKEAWDNGWRDPYRSEFNDWHDWIENRLDERLNDTLDFQELNDPTSGRQNFNQWRGQPGNVATGQFQFVTTSIPPELYYYH